MGELTPQFLLQLARNIDSYNPADAARLSDAALEILAARLAHELDNRDWGTPAGGAAAVISPIWSWPPARSRRSRLSGAFRARATSAAPSGPGTACPPAGYRRSALVVNGSAL